MGGVGGVWYGDVLCSRVRSQKGLGAKWRRRLCGRMVLVVAGGVTMVSRSTGGVWVGGGGGRGPGVICLLCALC